MPVEKSKNPTAKAMFCDSLGWTLKIKWFGLTGYAELSQGRLAKIELTEWRRISGTYDGFLVTILDTNKGRIDSLVFLFDEYLVDRVDGRTDYKGSFSVVSHTGWEWYIMVPKTPADFTKAVEQYIALFAPKEQTEFNVCLKAFGNGKIPVIKALREVIPGLRLIEAKSFVESVPVNVKEAISKEEAVSITQHLRAVGCEIEITPVR